jgi:hypothetical protein
LPWLWYRTTQERLAPQGERAADSIAAHQTFFPFKKLKAHARTLIPMLGHWSDPVPKIISHLHMLRHPGSVLRSQIITARALKTQTPR